ncbi:alpha/beta hydrolase [Paenibacillus sp. BK720]|uniref:alpha/beta hydrolase family protein n=1 Tax=Paenibacillus sp. BK720 TaxID=2587092 RepID=UPI00141FC56A|nr:alpha/beta hydrolase [Paenibacillus sp. BK720]NIK67556.1 dienelactone hydrolase [Paenibacillus sp. BK720]
MELELVQPQFRPNPEPRRKRFLNWLRARIGIRLEYDSSLWRSGAAGLLMFGSAAIITVALGMPTGFGAAIDIGAFVLANALALLIASQLIAIILSLMYVPVPRLFAGFLLYVGFECYYILYYSDFEIINSIVCAGIYTVIGAVVGILLGWFSRSRIRLISGVVIAAVTVSGVYIWIKEPFGGGHAAAVFAGAEETGGSGVAVIDADNPGEPGSFGYRFFTYGSGTDKQRKEYGKGAELISASVNASEYIKNWYWMKERFWGFDEEKLPLNGRVWMPDGEGPFPLVLMVHGNHLMEDFSDAGYDYLGKLLASRGYIAVSVDENFLNYSTWSGIPDNDFKVRAWMLLKHIQQIQTFSEKSDSAFYNKVDFTNIALIGHSRGGQAVAMAADRDAWFAGDRTLDSLDKHQVHIRTVIALAPTDKAIDNKSANLTDVNYLVLQGARDGDVNDFYGDRQYIRTSFTKGSGYMKASVYLSEANHSRFNTEWGTMDERPPGGLILSQRGMMETAEQQQAAKVYVSAFLESTLNHREEYIPLLQDYRTGLDWLPDSTAYVSRYEDSSFDRIARYDEDRNKTTLPKGGKLEGYNLKSWDELDVKDRDHNNKGTVGAQVEWLEDSSYTLSLAEPFPLGSAADNNQMFTFSLANLASQLDPDHQDSIPQIQIELMSTEGDTIILPLNAYMPVQQPFVTTYTIIPLLEKTIKGGKYKHDTESVFQTFRMPLGDFAEAVDRKDLSISRITFRFIGGPGKIMLDDIGLSN